MTVITNSPAGEALAPREDLVSVTIDGFQIDVPKGTLVIRAAELLGIQVPRFCDHPLLDPVGACRQCLVEVVDDGNGRAMPKPQASCTIPVTPGMVVKTQLTSPVADKAQQGIMEFLLINHPLDCPICDKGGECPLQNQAMSNGRSETRFVDVKRTFPKPINISAQVLLDRERCVLCARCTRFSDQVAGDPFIEMLERGALQQVGIYEDQPFNSYFSGNTVQICPVGALTSAKYRFRARPFDLVSTPTICEHCSSGCALRSDHRRGTVMRRQAGDDPEVNEEWNCDKGRWAFHAATLPDRIMHPMVRDADGVLRPASWPEALDVAARGLAAARGRDARRWSPSARGRLRVREVRPGGARDERHRLPRPAALGRRGRLPGRPGRRHWARRHLPRRRARSGGPAGRARARGGGRHRLPPPAQGAPAATAPPCTASQRWRAPGLAKAYGTLLPTVPGDEAAVLDALGGPGAGTLGAGRRRGCDRAPSAGRGHHGRRAARRAPWCVVRGGPARVGATGARLAWLPRRAGERAAVEGGAMPGLLPGGRPTLDATARGQVERRVGRRSVPDRPGRDTNAILAAAAERRRSTRSWWAASSSMTCPTRTPPGPHSTRCRSWSASRSAPARSPTAPTWCSRSPRTPRRSARSSTGRAGCARTASVLKVSTVLSDTRVLHQVASAMGVELGLPDVTSARRELRALGRWRGSRPSAPTVGVPTGAMRGACGQPGGCRHGAHAGLVLASWRMLLDEGRMADGEPYLARTARPAVARLSPRHRSGDRRSRRRRGDREHRARGRSPCRWP